MTQDSGITIGEMLRAARESQDRTLDGVNESTRLSVDVLRALEQDDFVAFESDVYLKGFLQESSVIDTRPTVGSTSEGANGEDRYVSAVGKFDRGRCYRRRGNLPFAWYASLAGVFGQLLSKRPAGSIKPAHDRPHRTMTHFGDFLVTQSL